MWIPAPFSPEGGLRGEPKGYPPLRHCDSRPRWGRQSRRCLESSSLPPPQAALRRFPRFFRLKAKEDVQSFSAGHAPAENSLTQPPWAASTSPQTGEGGSKGGGQRPPLYFRSAWRCSSSRRGPWWRRRRRSGYTGPWRRRASPSRWRPSERCSCRSASRGRRTPCRWGSG